MDGTRGGGLAKEDCLAVAHNLANDGVWPGSAYRWNVQIAGLEGQNLQERRTERGCLERRRFVGSGGVSAKQDQSCRGSKERRGVACEDAARVQRGDCEAVLGVARLRTPSQDGYLDWGRREGCNVWPRNLQELPGRLGLAQAFMLPALNSFSRFFSSGREFSPCFSLRDFLFLSMVAVYVNFCGLLFMSVNAP
ncbi:hypothetical protein NL676_039690 [Syzygium grande]|nr:hypothetical protein NL676_039690 [Syzygium grande]